MRARGDTCDVSCLRFSPQPRPPSLCVSLDVVVVNALLSSLAAVQKACLLHWLPLKRLASFPECVSAVEHPSLPVWPFPSVPGPFLKTPRVCLSNQQFRVLLLYLLGFCRSRDTCVPSCLPRLLPPPPLRLFVLCF